MKKHNKPKNAIKDKPLLNNPIITPNQAAGILLIIPGVLLLMVPWIGGIYGLTITLIGLFLIINWKKK